MKIIDHLPQNTSNKPQSTSRENHRILPFDLELRDYFAEFISDKISVGLAPASIELYFQTIQAFAFLRKSDFDRKDFIAYVTGKVAERNWTRRTLVNNLRRLSAFNRFLFYQSAVLRLHRAPRMSNKPRWRELPTADEWQSIIDSLKIRYETATLGRRKSRWRDYLICRVLHETGMRISECSNLLVGDLIIYDAENFWLFVNGTKSEDAERSCIIPEKLADEVRAYLWTFSIKSKAARMFTSKTGKPLDTIEFCKWVKKYCADIGISSDVTPHVFRHNFILQFIASGGSALELQARLGHSDIKMTVYYFNQVRRLLPFVKANADISILEAKTTARAKYFQRRNFTEDK